MYKNPKIKEKYKRLMNEFSNGQGKYGTKLFEPTTKAQIKLNVVSTKKPKMTKGFGRPN